jgi:hypothetical protein
VDHTEEDRGCEATETSSPRRALEAVAGLLVMLATFVLHLRTLAPTVLYYDYPSMRDASALQVKAYVLGIPDVTGYPTYTMLTHLFTYLPFGDPAYRVNLASAGYAAGAVYLVYLVCLRLTRRVVPSAAGALLFGTSETFWTQALIAEVYTLNALFVAAVVLVLFVWREDRKDRYLMFAAFLAGLSLTHHLTSGLLLPAGLLFVLLVDRGGLADPGLVLKGTGLFLLGLLPYLYLPVRASMEFTRWTISVDPTLVRYDPSNLRGFLDLVTGGDFKGAMFAFGLAEIPARAAYYLGYVLEQFHPGFLAVALLGAACLILVDRAAAVLLGALYFGWLFYALEYDISDVYYYFIPTYLVLAIFAAAGFAALLRASQKLLAGRPLRRTAVALVSAAFVLAPLAGASETYAKVDRSRDYEGHEALEAVAAKTETGATVIHHRSPLWYMNLVEGRRRDLKLVASFDLTLDSRDLKTIRAALEEGPVYILYPSEANASLMKKHGLDLVPVEGGTLYELLPTYALGGYGARSGDGGSPRIKGDHGFVAGDSRGHRTVLG